MSCDWIMNAVPNEQRARTPAIRRSFRESAGNVGKGNEPKRQVSGAVTAEEHLRPGLAEGYGCR